MKDIKARKKESKGKKQNKQGKEKRAFFRPILKSFFPGFLLKKLELSRLASIGTFLVFVIWASTILIWSRLDFVGAYYYYGPVLFFASFFALTGITLLCINLILSSKALFLTALFKGYDRVYRVHNIVGRLAWVSLTIHGTLMIISVLPDGEAALNFFIPGSYWPYNLGPIALVLMDVIILLTVWIKLPYHVWKAIHNLMIIPVLLGGIHAILGASDMMTNDNLKYWTLILLAVGSAMYTYRLVLYRFTGPRHKAKVEKVSQKGRFTEIYLRPEKSKIEITPGQFFFLSFTKTKGKISREDHPFSVSQVTDDGLIRFSAQNVGDYTERLSDLIEGDEALIFGPYGSFGMSFFDSTSDRKSIWIAGGSGVTPFLSMLQAIKNDSAVLKNNDKVHFIYSVTKKEDAVYDEEISKLVKGLDKVEYTIWVTNGEKENRLDAKKIKEILGMDGGSLVSYGLCICGPVSMTESLTKQLSKEGIKAKNIDYEVYTLG